MAAIDDFLVSESGRIGGDIYQKTLHTNPWLDLIQKDVWPEEMGEKISVLTYNRSMPTSFSEWQDVTFNANVSEANSSCVPEADVVGFSQTLREYGLQQYALESPKFCVNDLRYNHKRKKQLESCFSVLTQNASWAWQTRHRKEYDRISEHKVSLSTAQFTANGKFPEDPLWTNVTDVPDTVLTAGILQWFYTMLIRDGAHRDGGFIDVQNGKPQFIAIMGPEMDELIVNENAAIREDRRYADAPDLLKPLGIDRAYRGFYHLIDPMPPRWKKDGTGEWEEVLPYVEVARDTSEPSPNDKPTWEVNPDYYDPTVAEYEDVFLFLPSVYKCLVPKPITAPGGNTKFEPHRYMGDFKWKNIPDETLNPDETIGYFRGIFMAGSEPIHPEFGYVLRCLRADVPFYSWDTAYAGVPNIPRP